MAVNAWYDEVAEENAMLRKPRAATQPVVPAAPAQVTAPSAPQPDKVREAVEQALRWSQAQSKTFSVGMSVAKQVEQQKAKQAEIDAWYQGVTPRTLPDTSQGQQERVIPNHSLTQMPDTASAGQASGLPEQMRKFDPITARWEPNTLKIGIPYEALENYEKTLSLQGEMVYGPQMRGEVVTAPKYRDRIGGEANPLPEWLWAILNAPAGLAGIPESIVRGVGGYAKDLGVQEIDWWDERPQPDPRQVDIANRKAIKREEETPEAFAGQKGMVQFGIVPTELALNIADPGHVRSAVKGAAKLGTGAVRSVASDISTAAMKEAAERTIKNTTGYVNPDTLREIGRQGGAKNLAEQAAKGTADPYERQLGEYLAGLRPDLQINAHDAHRFGDPKQMAAHGIDGPAEMYGQYVPKDAAPQIDLFRGRMGADEGTRRQVLPHEYGHDIYRTALDDTDRAVIARAHAQSGSPKSVEEFFSDFVGAYVNDKKIFNRGLGQHLTTKIKNKINSFLDGPSMEDVAEKGFDARRAIRPQYAPNTGAQAKLGDELFEVDTVSPTFYSEMERSLEKMPARMTPEQLEGFIRSKAKPDEIEWSGLKRLIDERKAMTDPKARMISRAELLGEEGYLNKNRFNLKETLYGNEPPSARIERTKKMRARVRELEEMGVTTPGVNETIDDTILAEYQAIRHDLAHGTNYSGDFASVKNKSPRWHVEASGKPLYTVGGENYRELTISVDRTPRIPTWEEFRAGFPEDPQLDKYLRETYEMVKKGEAFDPKANPWVNRERFTSSHFDEKDIIGHVRFQDFVDTDGKKVLLLDEIQSDWIQKGKKYGFMSPADEVTKKQQGEQQRILNARIQKTIDDLETKTGIGWQRNQTGVANGNITDPEIVEAIRKIRQGQSELADLLYQSRKYNSMVPDAPYKNSWSELLMKRMARWGAENGYDRVAWTTGRHQADRYNLVNFVDDLGYNPETNHLFGYKNGEAMVDDTVSPDKLSEYIGVEAARKLLDSPQTFDGYHNLVGEQLSVTKTSKNNLYDRQIPNQVANLSRKQSWGTNIGTTDIVGAHDPYYFYPKIDDVAERKEFHDLTETYAKWMDSYYDYDGVRTDADYDKIRQKMDDLSKEIYDKYGKGWKNETLEEYLEQINNNLDLHKSWMAGEDIGSAGKAVTTTVHSFDITDAMRKAVMQRGQPLFALAPMGIDNEELSAEQKLLMTAAALLGMSKFRGPFLRQGKVLQKLKQVMPENVRPEEVIDFLRGKKKISIEEYGTKKTYTPEEINIARVAEKFLDDMADEMIPEITDEAFRTVGPNNVIVFRTVRSPVEHMDILSAKAYNKVDGAYRPSAVYDDYRSPVSGEQGGGGLFVSRSPSTVLGIHEYPAYRMNADGEMTDVIDLSIPRTYAIEVPKDSVLYSSEYMDDAMRGHIGNFFEEDAEMLIAPEKVLNIWRVPKNKLEDAVRYIDDASEALRDEIPDYFGDEVLPGKWQRAAEDISQLRQPKYGMAVGGGAGASNEDLSDEQRLALGGAALAGLSGAGLWRLWQKGGKKAVKAVLGDLPKLPATDDVIKRIEAPSAWGKLARMASEIPGVKGVVEHIDPWAVASEHLEKIPLAYRQLEDISLNIHRAAMSKLEGIPLQGFRTQNGRFVKGVIAKAEYPDASLAISDVLERPYRYQMPESLRAFIETANHVNDQLVQALKDEGVKIKEIRFEQENGNVGHYFGRLVREVEGASKRLAARPDMPRAYDTMEAGLQAGVKYEEDLLATASAVYGYLTRKVVSRRMTDLVSPLGRTPKQLVDDTLHEAAGAAQKELRTVTKFNTLLTNMKNGRSPYNMRKMPDGNFRPVLASSVKTMDALVPGMEDRLRKIASLKGKSRKDEIQRILDEVSVLRKEKSAVYFKAKRARANAMESSRSAEFADGSKYGLPAGTIGVERIKQPWASGRFFPRDVSDFLNKEFARDQSKLIRNVSTVNDTIRTLKAGFDLGAINIQLLPTMVAYPKAWAKASKNMVSALLDPQTYHNYMARPDNQEIIRKMVHHGMNLEGIEYGAGIQRGAPLERVLPKAVTKRIEAIFTAPINTGKVEIAKALAPSFEKAGQLNELAMYLNNLTGTRSGLASGLGAEQRAIESTFLFFSPRMTRSALALVGDAAQGGLKGNEARKALASLAAANILIMGGLRLATEGKIEEDFFDPTSGQFMSFKMFDRKVGFGGTHRSLVTTLAQSMKAAQTDPSRFMDPTDRRNNPLTRWWAGRSSPVTGLLWDVVERRDFLGEPLDSPQAWGAWAAEKPVPMWLQDYVPGPNREMPHAGGLVPEVLGMRVIPESPAEKRNESRDQVALQMFNKKYEDLNTTERYDVNSQPQVGEMIKDATGFYAKRGSTLHSFWEKRDEMRGEHLDKISDLKVLLDNGEISGNQYRENVQQEERNMARIPEVLKRSPGYKDVPVTTDEWARWAVKNGMDPNVRGPIDDVDRFVEEYYSLAEKVTDPKTGLLDPVDLVREREKLKQQYDPSKVDEALRYINRNRHPEYVQAQKELSEMMAIPKYLTLNVEESDIADEVGQYIRDRARSVDSKMANLEAIERYGEDSYILYKIAVKTGVNPERKFYWAEHPLLEKYYTDTPAKKE